jgi:hypothetical protein
MRPRVSASRERARPVKLSDHHETTGNCGRAMPIAMCMLVIDCEGPIRALKLSVEPRSMRKIVFRGVVKQRGPASVS